MHIHNHRIGRMHPLAPVSEALRSPAALGDAARLAASVLRFFFFPQFETRFNPSRRPVVNVDHPLDDTVPFRPDLVGEYLTFFFLWVQTARYFREAYGGRRGHREFRGHLAFARDLYADCGKVYLRRQSTTNRPRESANAGFSLIHSVDPHLHCVPSLHVLLVVANWLRAARVLGAHEGMGRSRREKALAYLRQEAVRITESILFVKQHSVNCIGASMFYLHQAFPEFGEEQVAQFVDSLFTYEGADLPSKDAIRARVMELYGELKADHEGRAETRWERTILRWLKAIPANPPF